MNKPEGSKVKYFVQWNSHPKHISAMLCSLMEHQSLIDIAICCGTNTIHAHKCILAANSAYFKEQLEKNSGAEQVVITGVDFAVIKSVIEFMYCGETAIIESNLKYVIAVAKLFQMRGLQSFTTEEGSQEGADAIEIPPLLFISKKPKYSNAYRPIGNATTNPPIGPYRNMAPNDVYMHQKKLKRKVVRSEAEQACAKEAAASRMALEALQKELSTSQGSSFVIEETCTETTVENFIPHTDDTYIEQFNQVPLQVLTYANLNNSMMNCPMTIEKGATNGGDPLHYDVTDGADKFQMITDKIRDTVGNNIFGNVEIMFKTNDGRFTNITDDIMHNFTGGDLQYQLVDEQGHVGEINELAMQDANALNYASNPDALDFALKGKDNGELPSAKILAAATDDVGGGERFFVDGGKVGENLIVCDALADKDVTNEQIANFHQISTVPQLIPHSEENKENEVRDYSSSVFLNQAFPAQEKTAYEVNDMCLRLCDSNILMKNALLQPDCLDDFLKIKKPKNDRPLSSSLILSESFEVDPSVLPMQIDDDDEDDDKGKMKENEEQSLFGLLHDIPLNYSKTPNNDENMRTRKKK